MNSPPTDPSGTREGSTGAVRHLLWVASGKLFVLGSMFACGVVIARAAEGPAEYAIFAAGLTLVLLIDATIGAPLDLATIRFGAIHRDEPQRVDRFAAAAFRIKLVIGAGMAATALVVSRPLAELLFDTPDRTALLMIAIVSAMALLLIRGTAVHLQVRLLFHRYAVLDATQGGLRLLATAALLALGMTRAEWFLAAYGLAAALVFALGIVWIRQPYMLANWPQRSDTRAIIAFLGPTAGVVILGTVTGRSDVLFLTALGDAERAGHYAAAAHMATMATMLAVYGAIVCQPRVIPAAQAGRLGQLVRWNLISATVLALLAVPVSLLLFDPLVPALFGSDYAPAVPVVKVLVIGTCADIFFMPVMMTFAMQMYPRTSLACEVGVTLAFLVAAPLAAVHGPMAMAAVATVVRLVKFACYAGITWRHLRYASQR